MIINVRTNDGTDLCSFRVISSAAKSRNIKLFLDKSEFDNCWISDIDQNIDGEYIYRIDLEEHPLKDYSTRELLEEIERRCGE